MSTEFTLRPVSYGSDGRRWRVTEEEEEEKDVFNNIRAAASVCLRNGRADEGPCFGSWSWDETRCTDALPFKVEGRVAVGIFTQVSSRAMALGIYPGSRYVLSFLTGCSYRFDAWGVTDPGALPVVSERGSYNWTRASRTSATDGIGGNNAHATLECDGGGDGADADADATTTPGKPWSSVWIARERLEGSFQCALGFATFEIVE